MNLQNFINSEIESPNSNELLNIIESISFAAIKISKLIFSPERKDLDQNIGSINADGDKTKKLDIETDLIVKEHLKNCNLKWYASEEENAEVLFNKQGKYSICIDPLDGSSNIETNAPIGTIFGIYAEDPDYSKNILQKGDKLKASGFFVYGPRTIFVLTLGSGVLLFQLNNEDKFILLDKSIKIPPNTNELSINFSNYTIWPNSIKRYIDKCIGVDKTMSNKNYNMRWIGSLVADCLRILIRGGIFMYPQDLKKPEKAGRLRLMYEANPMAFLMEKAGGKATTGRERLLGVTPDHFHQRISVIMGSEEEVERIERYYEEHDEGKDIKFKSPLFKERSLFEKPE